MIRKTRRGVCVRTLLLCGVGSATVVVLINFTGSGAGSSMRCIAASLAVYEADHGKFPRQRSTYQSMEGTDFVASPIDLESKLKALGLLARTSGPLLPSLGESDLVTSSFDVLAELEFGPGSEPFVIDSFFDITFRVIGDDGGGGGGGGGSWPIELVAMNLVGSSPTVGKVMLRESPIEASTGEYNLTPLGGGVVGLTVDSFFDVFFELSLDNGFSWRQAEGPFRMNLTSLVPEPGTVGLALVAAAGVGAMRRRRR